jgi:hypothetical protein
VLGGRSAARATPDDNTTIAANGSRKLFIGTYLMVDDPTINVRSATAAVAKM